MIDIAKLKELISESEAASAFFEYLSGRERNGKETSVEQAMRVTRMDRTTVVHLFRQLADLELGTFKTGRRGMPSRFEWAVRMIDAARVAFGEADNIEILDDAEVDEPVEDNSNIEHSFMLRHEIPAVSISLPADLTTREAERLSRFILSLPIEG